MRKFKYIGTEKQAEEYSSVLNKDIPVTGQIYFGDKCFGGCTVEEWADDHDWTGVEEWEEVFDHVVKSPVSDNYYCYNDPVNPQHYKNGEVECIEAIKSAVVGKDGFAGYLTGNLIKYVWRYENKNKVEDLNKASWYLNKLIEHENGKNNTKV